MRKPSSESKMTLKVATTQVVETFVANNSPSQDSNHPDDLFQSRYVTPGFKNRSVVLRRMPTDGTYMNLDLLISVSFLLLFTTNF